MLGRLALFCRIFLLIIDVSTSSPILPETHNYIRPVSFLNRYSSGQMIAALPTGDVAVLGNSESGCALSICPGSNCFNTSFSLVPPQFSMRYCQFESSESIGERDLIYIVAALDSTAIIIGVNISNIQNFTYTSYAAFTNVETRGIFLFRSADHLPYAITPCGVQLCILKCSNALCTSSTTKTASVGTANLLLRGAVFSASGASTMLFYHSTNTSLVFLTYCLAENFTACNTTSISSNLFDATMDGALTPSVVKFGSNSLKHFPQTDALWAAIYTTRMAIFIKIQNFNCSQLDRIWNVSRIVPGGDVIQPDWTIYQTGASPVLIATLPQLSFVPRPTQLIPAFVGVTACFFNSENRSCETHEVWRGDSHMGASLSRMNESIFLGMATSEIAGYHVSVAKVNPFCPTNEISSAETGGKCAKCPAGSFRRDFSTCTMCNRALGQGSLEGSTFCSSCTDLTGKEMGCSTCSTGSFLNASSCLSCPSKSYWNPSINQSTCLPCLQPSITSKDATQCLESSLSSSARQFSSCSGVPEGSRTLQCLDHTYHDKFNISDVGALCRQQRCICVEGWRFYKGICYPPEPLQRLCVPKLSRARGTFAATLSSLQLVSSTLLEVEIVVPLESYAFHVDSRVLDTQIRWTSGNGECDFPFGSKFSFYSKGTRYPECNEIFGGLWPLESILSCPWLAKIDRSKQTITRLAILNITRSYEVLDPISGSFSIQNRWSAVPIQFTTPSTLVRAPGFIDEAFYGIQSPDTLDSMLIIILGVIGAIAGLIFVVAVVIFARSRRRPKLPIKHDSQAAAPIPATKEDKLESVVPVPAASDDDKPPKRRLKPATEKSSSSSLSSPGSGVRHPPGDKASELFVASEEASQRSGEEEKSSNSASETDPEARQDHDSTVSSSNSSFEKDMNKRTQATAPDSCSVSSASNVDSSRSEMENQINSSNDEGKIMNEGSEDQGPDLSTSDSGEVKFGAETLE